ncbi:metallophosphoesterase family protein [Sphingomonas rubra]|uniref:Serine/threonine protein phosphatase 1 n=1 Tax=Sphingomonas rubra TaxID=634430 RepID=A0A1I5QWH9_9SPHN|nr:metallophosphoesterase family protein [Sphingomonas rubra]SFP50629.1 serine/threonine protein phosphatase 1 [Sphingomonas rubra]
MPVLKSFLRKKKTPQFRVPDGERVYAVGDVHGCADQFEQLLAMIDADDAARGPADTTLVLLGDLVDRGPDTRGVLEHAMRRAAHPRFALLKGNHEEMLLRAAAGHRPSLQLFNRYGGRDTLMSYGVDPVAYDEASFEELEALIVASVPAAHRAFLDAGRPHLTVGDYLFVHAGIRPGVPLADQVGADLRWIRDPFLGHRGSHGVMVIHGHTITDEPDVQSNRIGIDTGAYAGGPLTAIGLEGEERWFLTA